MAEVKLTGKLKIFKEAMKRIFSFLILLVFGITLAVPFLAVSKNMNSSSAETISSYADSSFDEDSLKNKQTIVSTDINELSGYLLTMATENNNPYDTEAGQMMTGASITPTSNSYGEVNSSTFIVNNFSMQNSSSIFMWIFIPDETYYTLNLSFLTKTGESVSWNIDFLTLGNMIIDTSSKTIKYGWKLFEFHLSDAEINFNMANIQDLTFETMTISYIDTFERNRKTSNNTLSFYDVFVAEHYGSKTNIIKIQEYSYYKLSFEFRTLFDSLYIGDTYTFTSIESIFDSIYVGKYDLKSYTNNNYTWQTVFLKPGEESDSIDFNSEYVFDEEGWYTINIVLREYRSGTDNYQEVLRASVSTYCNEFDLGAFDNASYSLEKGEIISFNFKLVNDFVLDGEIEVVVSDTNIAEATYYVSRNTCQIQVLGKDKGTVTVSVRADGHRVGESETASYEVTTRLTVNEQDSLWDFKIIILWITLGLYLIGIIIYVIIAIVKHKKHGVR